MFAFNDFPSRERERSGGTFLLCWKTREMCGVIDNKDVVKGTINLIIGDC